MKTKLEIQILSPATREQLTELRDEIRKIAGMEAFDLHIPPPPLVSDHAVDSMSGVELTTLVMEAVVMGTAHFAYEKILPFYEEKLGPLFKRVLADKPAKHAEQNERMSSSKAGQGGVQITVSATNAGKQTVSYFDETGITKTVSNREYSIDRDHTYAILIGTSDYDDAVSFSSIPPVKKNMDVMKRIFTNVDLMGIPEENITMLTDQNCINIKETIQKVSRKADIKTLIFYYTGHGHRDTTGQLSLVAKDTRNIDEELHNDIPYSFIEKMLTTSPAEQKIVFLDACHSGVAAQGNANSFIIEPVTGSYTLASTSAEEASYFKRNGESTYFTSYLVDILRNGVKSMNKMLSLDDIFAYVKARSQENNMPLPECKSKLKNITTDKYFISGNPGYSTEVRFARPKELVKQGLYEEAKKDYLSLLDEEPDNISLRKEYTAFEKEMLFNDLVEEGDRLFYRAGNAAAAKRKYEEAISVKYDEGVNRKIKHCDEEVPAQPMGVSPVQELPETYNWKKKLVYLLPLLIIAFAVYWIVNQKEHDKEAKITAHETDSIKNEEKADTGAKVNIVPPPPHPPVTADVVTKSASGAGGAGGRTATAALPAGNAVPEGEKSTGTVFTAEERSYISNNKYWEPKTNDNLQFSFSSDSKVSFTGSIGGKDVQGEMKVFKNKYCRVVTSNPKISGYVNFNAQNLVADGFFNFADGFSKGINLQIKTY